MLHFWGICIQLAFVDKRPFLSVENCWFWNLQKEFVNLVFFFVLKIRVRKQFYHRVYCLLNCVWLRRFFSSFWAKCFLSWRVISLKKKIFTMFGKSIDFTIYSTREISINKEFKVRKCKCFTLHKSTRSFIFMRIGNRKLKKFPCSLKSISFLIFLVSFKFEQMTRQFGHHIFRCCLR